MYSQIILRNWRRGPLAPRISLQFVKEIGPFSLAEPRGIYQGYLKRARVLAKALAEALAKAPAKACCRGLVRGTRIKPSILFSDIVKRLNITYRHAVHWI